MDVLLKYKTAFDDLVKHNPTLDKVLTPLEEKTKLKRLHLAYGLVAGVVGWLMFGHGAQLLCNLIGFLYPAYCSIKAIESESKDDDTQWLMYWVVFAVFSLFEFFSDLVCWWIPFYWFLKCIFLVWCMSSFKGAEKIYYAALLPWFKKNEKTFDKVLDESKLKISQVLNVAESVSS